MKNILTILLISIGFFTYQNISAQSCDTLRNYSLADNFYEISGTYGALLGHDKVNGGTSNVTQWAEPYSVGASTEVRRLVFVPWVVHDAGGGQVTFNVYQDNGGIPGAIMGSQTVPLADFNENVLTEVDFTTPVTVNGNFFVGYELAYNAPQDTFAITGTFKPGGINYTQMFFDAAWDDVDNIYVIGPDPLISAWRLDVLCSNAPDPVASYSSNAYTACIGSQFNVDGSTSQNTDQYLWFLTGTGATPIYDTDEGPTGTLTPTVVGNDQELILLADGGCKTDGIAYLVDVFNPVSATVSTVNATCGLNNGQINFTSPTGGSGTYSYSINNGGSFQSNANFTGVAPGSYNVLVNTGGNGCSYTETVTVGATPQETITVGTGQTICVGETATMTASGTGSIEWFEGVTSIGNGTSITVSPTTTTTYDAVLTDANNCEDTDQITITVNPLPAINAGADDAVCIGNAYTLTATGGASYTWNNSLGAGASHSVSPTATTTYEVTGTDANGCVNTDQIVLTVNALPIVNAGTDQTSCAGTSVTISATGASTYNWTGLGAGASQVVNPTTTTVYTVTGTDANGCENTDQVTINVNALPAVNAGTDVAICDGDNTTLTATGASSYSWDNGLGAGATQSVTPNTTTTYEVTGTDANGCVNTATVEVTVNPIDDPSFTFNDYCEVAPSNGPTSITTSGGTFAFNPTPTDGATINGSTGEISNGVTGATYTVEYTTNGTCPSSSIETVTVQTNDDPSFNYNDICLGNGLPIQPTNIATTGGTFNFVTAPTDGATIDGSTGVVSGATQGSTYNVQYTTPTGVCQASSTVTVEVFNAPTIIATGGQTICEQDVVTMNATGGNTYNWDNGLGSGNTQNVSPNTTTTYTVTGTDANGCTNTDDVTVTVNALPSVQAGVDQVVCEGETVNISASGATSYSWDNGLGAGATQSFTASTTTTYVVTGTDGNNCVNTDDVVITVNPSPTISAGADQAICNGEQTTITASGGNTYNWNNGLGVGAAHNITPSATTTYEVTGTDLNGCENTDQVTVTVNPVPTINAGIDQEVCEGEEVTLTATASNGTISWDNNVTNGVPFNATSTTTYTATADDNGCTATDILVVTVNPSPIVTMGADETTCINYEPLQLVGSPSGGTFAGPGVTGTEFDPDAAGVGVHTITYTYQDGNGCENSAVQVITVDGCASLDENDIDNSIVVKPNPATDYIDIVVENVKSIQLMTSEGRVIDISLNILNDNTSRIDVSNLSKGTYILRINTKNISTTRKVIIH